MERKCGDCAIRDLYKGQCPVFRREMPEDEGGCPLHTHELIHCDICGNHIPSHAIFDDGHIICYDCFSKSMCFTCTAHIICPFEQDKNCKEPPIVVVQEHPRPNMTVQKQIPNPKRIAETCAKGCLCYYEAGLEDGMHCIKQLPNSGCENYKTAWRS